MVAMSKTKFETLGVTTVRLVDCPKLDTQVRVDKTCNPCRFFNGYTFDMVCIKCSYKSDKL